MTPPSEELAPLEHVEMQSQRRICPHCFDDTHHYSEPAGCEREANADSARIRIGPTDV